VTSGYLWRLKKLLRAKHASSVHGRLHPLCIDVIPILKIASVEDDLSETDMRLASSGMEAIYCHVVLRRPSTGIAATAATRVWCSLSFSTAVIPQPQLRQLHWLVFEEGVGELPSRALC
jgi:hypothetical protein